MFIVTSLCVCHPHWTLLLYDYCTTTVLYYYCTTTVLLLYYCITTVLLLYYCTTTVLLLYCYCTTTVVLYYYCTTAVLLYYHCWRRKVATSPRVQAFNHANPWEGLRVAPTCWKKCATLPRVRAFDHANPWEGLRVTPKMCNFTSRSCIRPRQSMGRVARHADMLEKCATLPRVRAFDHANPREGLRVTPKMCNFISRSSVRPRQFMGRVARHAENVQLYLAFKRSTTPIHGKVCASRRHVGKNLQLYLAFVRLTTPIHGKGCASCRQLYLAFKRSPTPIRGKGCVLRRQVAILPRVRAFDHANPWEGLRVTPKMCNCTSRSRLRLRQSMGRVARYGYKLGKCATLPRVRSFDHADPREGLHVMPTSCDFTARSHARPRQSMVSVAFPIDGIGAGSGFRKII